MRNLCFDHKENVSNQEDFLDAEILPRTQPCALYRTLYYAHGSTELFSLTMSPRIINRIFVCNSQSIAEKSHTHMRRIQQTFIEVVVADVCSVERHSDVWVSKSSVYQLH